MACAGAMPFYQDLPATTRILSFQKQKQLHDSTHNVILMWQALGTRYWGPGHSTQSRGLAPPESTRRCTGVERCHCRIAPQNSMRRSLLPCANQSLASCSGCWSGCQRGGDGRGRERSRRPGSVLELLTSTEAPRMHMDTACRSLTSASYCIARAPSLVRTCVLSSAEVWHCLQADRSCCRPRTPPAEPPLGSG